MTKTLHGKVHGKTIELDEDLGVPEGQEVEITVRVVPSVNTTRTGEGLLLTEGPWPTIPTGTPSWRKFITSGRTIRAGNSRNDLPARHGHVLGAHVTPARLAHRFIQYTGSLAIPTIVLGQHPRPPSG